MKLTKYGIVAPIVILLMTTAAPAAKGWDGPWHHVGCGWNGCGDCGFACGGLGLTGGGGGCEGCWGGYQAGIQDAIYDHVNNLEYQPYGSCLPCHSQEYWDNFREGYNTQWNSYQGQESNQGSSINIYGNNNYVSTDQVSDQQQNPLQQLGHVVCGFINCNQPQGGP